MIRSVTPIVFFLEHYERYSEAVGHKIGTGVCLQVFRENNLLQISNKTSMMQYLSVQDDMWEGDWLYLVIRDVVSPT